MTIWDKISNLADIMLGKSKTEKVNLSKISKNISRPQNIQPDQKPNANKQNIDISDIDVLPEYQFILKAIEEKCPAIFVTGKAGTGKSTLIRYLSKHINKCAIVAFTARAAINVGGSTIHSFFNFPLRALNCDEAFSPREQLVPVVENLDVLIIDEVSMVSPDLIDCISNSLMKVRRNEEPFGGVPIVLVGDLLQLPPVVSDKDVAVYFTHAYDSSYFFAAKVFSKIDILPIELTKVFRQKNESFVKLLDEIRTNLNHEEAMNFINKSCCNGIIERNINTLFLVPTNAAAKSINTVNLNKIKSNLISYKATISGKMNINKDRPPAPDLLELKVGALVVFLKNKRPHWVNGTIGEIMRLSQDSISVKIIHTGNIVPVARETWDTIEYCYDYEEKRILSKIIGSFKQFPLALGWAMTIHKSQGMTLDSVNIDLGRGAFCPGQTYVALSRCKSLSGIKLVKPLTLSDIKADTTAIEFYKKLGFIKDNDNSIQ